MGIPARRDVRKMEGKNLVLCRTDISAAAGPIETGPARMSLGKTREKYKVRGGPKNARAHPETRVDPENGRFWTFFRIGSGFRKPAELKR